MNFLVNHQTAPPSNSSFAKLAACHQVLDSVVLFKHNPMRHLPARCVCVYSSSCAYLWEKCSRSNKINNPSPIHKNHTKMLTPKTPRESEVHGQVRSSSLILFFAKINFHQTKDGTRMSQEVSNWLVNGL